MTGLPSSLVGCQVWNLNSFHLQYCILMYTWGLAWNVVLSCKCSISFTITLDKRIRPLHLIKIINISVKTILTKSDCFSAWKITSQIFPLSAEKLILWDEMAQLAARSLHMFELIARRVGSNHRWVQQQSNFLW